jgi:hypothetical protein
MAAIFTKISRHSNCQLTIICPSQRVYYISQSQLALAMPSADFWCLSGELVWKPVAPQVPGSIVKMHRAFVPCGDYRNPVPQVSFVAGLESRDAGATTLNIEGRKTRCQATSGRTHPPVSVCGHPALALEHQARGLKKAGRYSRKRVPGPFSFVRIRDPRKVLAKNCQLTI